MYTKKNLTNYFQIKNCFKISEIVEIFVVRDELVVKKIQVSLQLVEVKVQKHINLQFSATIRLYFYVLTNIEIKLIVDLDYLTKQALVLRQSTKKIFKTENNLVKIHNGCLDKTN